MATCQFSGKSRSRHSRGSRARPHAHRGRKRGVARSTKELQAAIEALPWQQREVIFEATSGGRAVRDASLAGLAAEWASAQRARLLRILLLLLVPLAVAAGVGAIVAAERDASMDAGGLVFAVAAALVMMSLIYWAVALRPPRRAEQANLAVVGRAEPPSRRDASNWVLAVLIAWWPAALVGGALAALDVTILSGPVGAVVWVAMIWAVKRALDSRAGEWRMRCGQ